ncbi:cobalamin B12-binding domain-containing protein [Parabacteroides faecis]|uniref:5-methyltetrahydrofolate--homocysteine methyltransferase n=1 Tax=Parabacteroides faecis TaxID=1217282 RepID=A0ABR6KLD2_9BACT|nr:corrinoid protein [Parabacteroides faecis]MBB4622189.1 5-methyltetrahydrofolate--homocysteine methyltransferase [Parabacteroides faecis]GGJ80673.1 corrinoid methyltransferase [Parabacteroides faecis]
MNDIIIKLGECVEFGKISLASPYPPAMKGQPGADELTREALESGLSPQSVLNDALIPAMNRVGNKFTEGKIFVPQMLLSAKAMNSAMKHLKPYFQNGEIKRKGVFVIGTVMGDLHDIGKNLTGMMVEGSGWEVIDLGTDVPAEKYIQALDEHPGAVCGMSALLTTTMSNMQPMIATIRAKYPETKVVVGGAPLNADFAQRIGADAYARDPQDNINWLELIVACNSASCAYRNIRRKNQ